MNAPAETSHSLRGAIGVALFVVAAVVLVASRQELAVGQSEVRAADEAMGRLDWADAIDHAKAAALALAPMSPWPERGGQRLRAIAHDAETRGDATVALRAYGALRAAALATAYPGFASSRWRSEAEAGLTRVVTWETGGGPAARAAGAPANETAASMRSALMRDTMPKAAVFAVLAASTMILLGGVFWLASGRAGPRSTWIAQGVIAAALLTCGAVLLTN
jgi:hypothetical protein